MKILLYHIQIRRVFIKRRIKKFVATIIYVFNKDIENCIAYLI